MKILYVIDVKGWAYDRIASTLLEVGLTGDKVLAEELGKADIEQYEIVHFMGISLLNQLKSETLGRIKKYTICVDAPRSLKFLDTHRDVVKKAAGLIVLNRELERKCWNYNDNVKLIYNPIYASEWEKIAEPKTFTVGFAGNISTPEYDNHKGFSEFVVPACKKAGVKLKVLKYGESQIDPNKMEAWYNSISLLLMPSLSEGDSMTINEAMACGVPVLSTETGALADSPPRAYIKRDIDEIAKAIECIKHDKTLRDTLVEEGKNIIEVYHDRDIVTYKYNDFFSECLVQKQPKIQMILITIPRYHSIGMVIENIKRAEKPQNMELLVIASGDDKYIEYLEGQLKGLDYKLIRNKDKSVDHDRIRREMDSDPRVNDDKRYYAFRAYELAQKHCNPDADYYWFAEDDNLFPLDTYPRYMKALKNQNAEMVSGLSWHWFDNHFEGHNFWRLTLTQTFPPAFPAKEVSMRVEQLPQKDWGTEPIGAVGTCNMICKGDIFRGYDVMKGWATYNTGVDLALCIYAYEQNKKLLGIWDLELPHISKLEDGGIKIYGKIDKSLIPLLGGKVV